jgi:hypothetical protein
MGNGTARLLFQLALHLAVSLGAGVAWATESCATVDGQTLCCGVWQVTASYVGGKTYPVTANSYAGLGAAIDHDRATRQRLCGYFHDQEDCAPVSYETSASCLGGGGRSRSNEGARESVDGDGKHCIPGCKRWDFLSHCQLVIFCPAFDPRTSFTKEESAPALPPP